MGFLRLVRISFHRFPGNEDGHIVVSLRLTCARASAGRLRMEISLYALDYSDFADDSTFAYGCE
jgi:hypothetical protein